MGALRGHRARRVPRNTATATSACRSSRRRALFVRGIGEVTDIVEKEMYTFEDKLNGESLTLRPEATAGIVRAAIEHNLLTTGRSACGPAARCSATSGRRRAATAQFHQFDVEALGFAGPGRRRRADRDAARACGRALGLDRHRRCRSTRSADADERRAHRDRADRVFRAPRRRCSTTTRSAGCTPIRCASSTARTRRCRR